MKHSEFNRYIGDMPCKIITDIFEFKSATTFKAVCWDMARYGHYTTGANIRVSMETLAKECGVNRKTVHKVKDILKYNHLLVKTGTTPGNITIWALGSVVPYEDLRSPFPSNRVSVLEGHNNKEHNIDNILLSNSNEFDIPNYQEVKAEESSAINNISFDDMFYKFERITDEERNHAAAAPAGSGYRSGRSGNSTPRRYDIDDAELTAFNQELADIRANEW